MHPHVYTNGHICASILGRCERACIAKTPGPEWSPVLNAVSVCITMQSMLASCKKKEWCVYAAGPPRRRLFPPVPPQLTPSRPKGNDSYVARAPANPKHTRWEYHDDVGELLWTNDLTSADGLDAEHAPHAHEHAPPSPLMRSARRLSGCLPAQTL